MTSYTFCASSDRLCKRLTDAGRNTDTGVFLLQLQLPDVGVLLVAQRGNANMSSEKDFIITISFTVQLVGHRLKSCPMEKICEYYSRFSVWSDPNYSWKIHLFEESSTENARNIWKKMQLGSMKCLGLMLLDTLLTCVCKASNPGAPFPPPLSWLAVPPKSRNKEDCEN